MSDPQGDKDAAFIEVAQRLVNRLERMGYNAAEISSLEATYSPQNKNTQTINVNAGGWGVLIALIMVAFLAGLNISQAANQAKIGAEISDIRRRNDVANDKLSVILQWAPELAKKVDQQVHEKEKSK